MILIDKSKDVQDLVLTLTESTTVDEPVYSLVLKSDATRQVLEVALGENISTATTRYDHFKLSTNLFSELPEGIYSYSIFQDETKAEIVESGKALIKGSVSVVEVFSPESDNDDTYIFYNN